MTSTNENLTTLDVQSKFNERADQQVLSLIAEGWLAEVDGEIIHVLGVLAPSSID